MPRCSLKLLNTFRKHPSTKLSVSAQLRKLQQCWQELQRKVTAAAPQAQERSAAPGGGTTQGQQQFIRNKLEMGKLF